MNFESAKHEWKEIYNKTSSKTIFQIKIGRGKWEYVLAESMKTIDVYCKANGLKDWRTVGMLSLSECAEIRRTAKTI